MCIKYPFLYPRNRFTGLHYNNWKLHQYHVNNYKHAVKTLCTHVYTIDEWCEHGEKQLQRTFKSDFNIDLKFEITDSYVILRNNDKTINQIPILHSRMIDRIGFEYRNDMINFLGNTGKWPYNHATKGKGNAQHKEKNDNNDYPHFPIIISKTILKISDRRMNEILIVVADGNRNCQQFPFFVKPTNGTPLKTLQYILGNVIFAHTCSISVADDFKPGINYQYTTFVKGRNLRQFRIYHF